MSSVIVTTALVILNSLFETSMSKKFQIMNVLDKRNPPIYTHKARVQWFETRIVGGQILPVLSFNAQQT